MNDIKRFNIRRINNAESLIKVAMRQGVTLNAEEADMILGYFEGHDYCLMMGDEGATFRHDEQYEDDHSEDELYSIRDVIVFCQEMNDELLHEAPSDEGVLSQLQRDETILGTLYGREMLLCVSW